MSNSFITSSEKTVKNKFDLPMVSLNERQQALDLLPKLIARLAPQWPLRDFVAVNPLHGYNDMNLLQAMREVQSVRDAELLMPIEHYRKHLTQGTLSKADIVQACSQVRERFEVLLEAYSVSEEEILSVLASKADSQVTHQKEYQTFAEQVSYSGEITWENVIVEEISRHCGSLYADGNTAWQHPYKNRGLYSAWQTLKQVDYRMDWLGLRDFRQTIGELPESPVDCIVALLRWFEVPQKHWRGFLLAQWNSVVGWASYIQGLQFGKSIADLDDDELVGLLAVRLAYDACLARVYPDRESFKLWPTHSESQEKDTETRERLVTDLARFAGLVACEARYRQNLSLALPHERPEAVVKRTASAIQMVFCIDVRSEVLRRQIEWVSPEVETLGFAGFFGLPFQLHSAENDGSVNQLPVLLSPKFHVHETSSGTGCDCHASQPCKKPVAVRSLIEQLGSSAVACFGYVETLGLTYLPKLIQRLSPSVRSWRWKKDRLTHDGQTVANLIRKSSGLQANIELTERAALAKGILHNLGLKKRLGTLVVFVGHGSQSTNNPFQASLDCGACGGHSGESNARMAAQLLNDPEVRKVLRQDGIDIADECWFMAALHNTTTDEISFFEEDGISSAAKEELAALRKALPQATHRAQVERNNRFGSTAQDSVYRRALDWSEVRPEWGLVNNAAFIAAPRDLTKGLTLDGRVFLHSYDPATDEEGTILELILTAPVVVAHWINTQYYFSTVDPKSFGSGNKVLHSVMGGVGVVEGNGGDLKTGLPWQSVHDGEKFQHEPLRLSVFLYAKPEAIDRVIEKHPIVQNLVRNGWIHLTCWGNSGLLERESEGRWLKLAKN